MTRKPTPAPFLKGGGSWGQTGLAEAEATTDSKAAALTTELPAAGDGDPLHVHTT